MGKASRSGQGRSRSKGLPGYLKTVLVLAVLGILGYAMVGLSSGVAYDDKAIGVVDFSGLSASQKRSALQAANRSRCTCGCGMNTAQCVATDSTCPVREENIRKIRTMVRDAAREG
jgi:hypothetical protein